MSERKRLIFLSYSLLFFEILEFCTTNRSPDELNIPYVPYVVVEKNKGDMDLDRVQQTIFKYLENRSQRHSPAQERDEVEHSTTLYDYLRSGSSTGVYDYLRTSTKSNVYQDKLVDTRNSKLHPLNFHTPNYVHMDAAPTTYRGHLPYRYETTPVYNLSSSISKSYDTYATRYYPGVTDISAKEIKFVPLKESVYTSMQEGSLMRYHIPKKGATEYPLFDNNLPFGGSMKCSLKSSRYVYDGECKSKKPIVETVCADRCIKYDHNKLNQQYYFGSSYLGQYHNPADATQKPVIALACKDGDVKKQKIKLYCKDGTIINNIIRIVNSCVCQEHSEKVHAKKKSVIPVESFRKRTHSRSLPKIQMLTRLR